MVTKSSSAIWFKKPQRFVWVCIGYHTYFIISEGGVGWGGDSGGGGDNFPQNFSLQLENLSSQLATLLA